MKPLTSNALSDQDLDLSNGLCTFRTPARDLTPVADETIRAAIASADPRIHQVLDAWLAARAAGPVPRRADFDPLLVPGLLRFMWIYRFVPEHEDYICELAGEETNGAWGQSLKGRALRSIVGDRNHPTVFERWFAIRTAPQILHGARRQAAGTPFKGPVGLSDHRWVERLVMPLIGRDGTVDAVLGVALYDETFNRDNYTPTISDQVRMVDLVEATA